MSKKTIALTGSTGMLGSMVYKIMNDRYNLVLIYRDKDKLKALDRAYGGLSKHSAIQFDFTATYHEYASGGVATTGALMRNIGEVDAIINCAGVIIPHMLRSPAQTLFINGALPHILSSYYGEKLIHVTTDCVFSGDGGAPYDENARKSPKDLYGISKVAGEPSDQSTVLRTSIIGPELHGNASLLEWLRSQEGKAIGGFINHLWNGLTTKGLALAISRIIDNRQEFPSTGLFHLFSSDVSKYELLNMLKEKYMLDVTIHPTKVGDVDRRLATVKSLNDRLQIPRLDTMIDQL